MILGDHHADSATPDQQLARATLDDLFRHALARHPGALALTDPPDREYFTDGAPRRLTYAQADRAISAIARALQEFGLPADSIVGVQLPNTVESVLVLLGALRAGLVVAPIPLLWRTTEMTASLGRIGARALICCRRVGSLDHCELAMEVAAETFAIRFVAGFGQDLPDGLVSLDDVFNDAGGDAPALHRGGRPADHVAVVTFDIMPGGIVPLARNHTQLVAAGSAVVSAARIAADTVILAAFAISSFAGLAATVVPWLLTGGTLALHQPFSPTILSAQRGGEHCDTVVVPGPLVGRMLDAGLFGNGDDLKAVVAVWRAPERLSASATWPGGGPALVDLATFGEIGLVATRRSASGKPAAFPLGPMTASGQAVIEVARTANGTVALRGPMVPRHPFPLGATRGDRLRLNVDEAGFVDTEFACRLERDAKSVVVNGAPPGVVSVGGYRFALRELQNVVA
ncbi:MAG TPA: class I adenylate-forming enzyme family protein, partial [Xanthobacteraceae bacterium]|nr:class I adenylate-forming enzyme family protein [Xanthobacteraceae bacterium]